MTETSTTRETIAPDHRPYHYEMKTRDGSEHLVVQREEDGARFVITAMADGGSGTQMHVKVPASELQAMTRALRSIAAPPAAGAEVTGWIGGQADYWKRRARAAEAVIARVEALRAGEADSPGDPDTWPTPAQWIRRWNDATPEQRLAIAQAYIDLSRAAAARHAAH